MKTTKKDYAFINKVFEKHNIPYGYNFYAIAQIILSEYKKELKKCK